jgi:ribulose 1,5-bisphosphate synthetase/thiazole synthase
MPVVMGQVEMDDLARKLARMRYARAKGHIRSLDKKVRLDLYRVVVGTEQFHTRYTLPTKGLRITLIERREEYGNPNTLGLRATRFKYIECKVEPLPDYLRTRIEEQAEEGIVVA